MKKSTMKSIVSYIVDNDIAELSEVKDEILAELAKDEEKAQANRELYAQAREVVIPALSDTPVTINELFAEVERNLPSGFSKGKVQYAIGHYWVNDVNVIPGNPNTYTRKV